MAIKRQKGKLIVSEGILSDFINEKAISYEEPSRMGTPKGQPVGFSLPKYSSALLMLTSLSLKEIADKLVISYGLIKKWRTEIKFERLIRSQINEFCPFFFNKLRQRQDLFRKKIQEALKLPSNKILNIGNMIKCELINNTREFQDYNNYGKDLVIGILKYSLEHEILTFKLKIERISAKLNEEDVDTNFVFNPLSKIMEIDFLYLFKLWKDKYSVDEDRELKEYYQYVFQIINSICDSHTEVLDKIMSNYNKTTDLKMAKDAMKLIILYHSVDRQFMQLWKPI